MAGKTSTLILTVDLDCYICSKKIKKTICKLQVRERIQAVNFDVKNNTVTISGLFDPQKLKKKLLCKACNVIHEIKIKEEEKKVPDKTITTQPEKDKEKEKAKPAETGKEKEKEKAKPAETGKEKEKEKEKAKPAVTEKEKDKGKPAETKDKGKPAETEKEKDKAKPAETEKEKAWPVGPPLPSCCWRPWYEQYYGGCRCCSCGMFYGWPAPPLPPAGVCMGGPSTSTCQFFCEEDPSCTIM